MYWKTRTVYRSDFLIDVGAQLVNLAVSLAFLTLIFTQVENINGWTFHELLFLAGIGGVVMNFHHIFMLNIYNLGRGYIVSGDFDRFLIRPLNPLFQIYADDISEENISKFIVNIVLIVYASQKIGLTLLSPIKILYGIFFLVSGVMIFSSIYLAFASIAFWTARSKPFLWILFQVSDFRRYPFSIYSGSIQVVLTSIIPIAFASFFPATFFLGRTEWLELQIISLVAGPVFLILSYKIWSIGVSNYTSTGS